MTHPAHQVDNQDDVSAALRSVFGFSAFRPNQESIVRALLAGQDAFAVMPTGGGKSLCYQLPAHLLEGTGIIISPLISLMKDQVDAARANGLRAEYLNSSLPASQRGGVLRRLAGGQIDLLYVSPERFAMEEFLAALKRVKLCLFAVDEAHCISEWGHDFRPDYLLLARIVSEFRNVPVAAFTATATEHVQDDIIERLGLRSPQMVRASFDRPNLFYQVVEKSDEHAQILEFLRARPAESGIVYRMTRRDTETTAALLKESGVQALPYHAGMKPEDRQRNQEAFNRDQVQVIVATIAFGMGIDKSNIRFVVHGDLPKNIEGYYQETGRAGRDGEPAHCLLLFDRGDIARLRYFVNKIENSAERSIASTKLNEMAAFASLNACRRRRILEYFDEKYPADNCGGCDVCAGDVERTEATVPAQIAMSAIARTEERFGAGHVVDIVVGADTERIRQYGHNQVKTYGAGRDRDKQYWRRVIDDLVAQGCLTIISDPYPVLHLTELGRDVLFGRRKFFVLRTSALLAGSPNSEGTQRELPRRLRGAGALPGFRSSRSSEKPRKKRRIPAVEEIGDCDSALFERLRQLRRRLADEEGVPPFIIFSDRTLREMAAQAPPTVAQMHQITGVGEQKFKRYGQAFMEELRLFRTSG